MALRSSKPSIQVTILCLNRRYMTVSLDPVCVRACAHETSLLLNKILDWMKRLSVLQNNACSDLCVLKEKRKVSGISSIEKMSWLSFHDDRQHPKTMLWVRTWCPAAALPCKRLQMLSITVKHFNRELLNVPIPRVARCFPAVDHSQQPVIVFHVNWISGLRER